MAAVVAGGLLAACAAAEPPQEVPVMNAPAALIESAIDDAAERTKTPRGAIQMLHAEAVTWSDGSLGCPQPGMMYTQALVPGYRILLQAGDAQLAYHAGQAGPPQFCPADRAQEPAPSDRT